MGDHYFNQLALIYNGRVPAGADLVCYWFDKARIYVEQGKATRVGLVSTQAIRAGSNRSVLDQISKSSFIYEAWSNEPWINDGAALCVSIICFGPQNANAKLDGVVVSRIHSDLSPGTGQDMTLAKPLKANFGISFEGTKKYGDFDIPGDIARHWLTHPNPHGKPNSDVIKPWLNGRDVAVRPTDTWIIDFGTSMTEEDAAIK